MAVEPSIADFNRSDGSSVPHLDAGTGLLSYSRDFELSYHRGTRTLSCYDLTNLLVPLGRTWVLRIRGVYRGV